MKSSSSLLRNDVILLLINSIAKVSTNQIHIDVLIISLKTRNLTKNDCGFIFLIKFLLQVSTTWLSSIYFIIFNIFHINESNNNVDSNFFVLVINDCFLS